MSKGRNFFSRFAELTSAALGHFGAFIIALLLVLSWLFSGPFFDFSENWQLVINTGTTIVTFMMVFIIQHTQNRDMIILNLKLDELIKGHKGARNFSIDLSKLSDEDLKLLEAEYKKLCDKKTGC